MYQALNTELQTLDALAKGSRQATEQVYRQHSKIVIGWIVQNGGEAADAEDIFQESMVILYEKVQSAEFRLSCKIGTYLFAVSKHLWYKKLRQNQRTTLGGEDAQEIVYEEDVIGHEERELHYEQLDLALDKLGEPCRSLLKAYYQQDKSMQQIAADFGYTNADNAKTQKYKCLNRLRKLFYGA
ncbi:MAG TPA: sigma-70 family RNA polymerase sigma factor [Flavipsychrobacter sp.]|nr:sigma-70 family RNA polymerase sigma factor [Flavipsychrobacter sp.]